MHRIGLTGGIGAGKSTVARLLAAHGAIVVDADALAREVVAPGTPGLQQVVDAFGPSVVRDDGSLDREALGRIVFNDPDQRRVLEGITHPLIGQRTQELFAQAGQDDVVVHDVPLLVELGMAPLYDAVIVVEAPDDVRLTRLEGRGLPREQALERIKAQADADQRLAAATVVVDNAGDEQALQQRVDEVWAQIVG
ncbi:MAG: dephospho-CoA kinase [Frankiaceae bacterium]|jgi:dephospho-CoA kinase|nr:dephospho-CoA kinase [Frankiaceae bacterium]MDQ1671938.1 dephospho-CoA kinase [Frankiaceae bacterium]